MAAIATGLPMVLFSDATAAEVFRASAIAFGVGAAAGLVPVANILKNPAATALAAAVGGAATNLTIQFFTKCPAEDFDWFSAVGSGAASAAGVGFMGLAGLPLALGGSADDVAESLYEISAAVLGGLLDAATFNAPSR